MIVPDERLSGAQTIPFTRADPSKANPKSGVAQLEWNISGSLLLVRFGEDSVNPVAHKLKMSRQIIRQPSSIYSTSPLLHNSFHRS